MVKKSIKQYEGGEATAKSSQSSKGSSYNAKTKSQSIKKKVADKVNSQNSKKSKGSQKSQKSAKSEDKKDKVAASKEKSAKENPET